VFIDFSLGPSSGKVLGRGAQAFLGLKAQLAAWTGREADCYDDRVRTPKDWSVYVARCSDGSLYTGVAKDVKARLAAHNSGRGAAYTRSRRPVRLAYREDGFTRSAALSREAGIKRLTRSEKLLLLKAARAAARA
jgi:putative endonuclease